MAPNQIAFKAGKMIHFIAARSFALGNTGNTVPKGSDVMFDGTKADVDGIEYSLPQLRGAVKAGWLVLAENFDENDISAEIPVRANVQVRHAAQGGNPLQPNRTPTHAMATTENDEREVETSIRSRARETAQRNAAYRRGQPVNAGSTVLSQRGFEVVEEQDGVEIEGRTLKTAAGERSKQTRTVLTADSAGRTISEAGKVQVQPGRGVTEEEMLEQMDEEAREEYLAEKNALKSRYVDEDPAPRKVGRVRKAQTETREGVTLRGSTGGGVEIADPSYGGKAREDVIVQDGITFRTTNGPQRDVVASQRAAADAPSVTVVGQVHARPAPAPTPVLLKDGTMDVRRTIAKAMCSDFPDNYDFTQPDRKKIARLQADYEDRPDVLRAVYAAESDTFKDKLVEEFPQAFGK